MSNDNHYLLLKNDKEFNKMNEIILPAGQINILSAHRFKYQIIIDKYVQINMPFFLLGKSSTGKNSLCL